MSKLSLNILREMWVCASLTLLWIRTRPRAINSSERFALFTVSIARSRALILPIIISQISARFLLSSSSSASNLSNLLSCSLISSTSVCVCRRCPHASSVGISADASLKFSRPSRNRSLKREREKKKNEMNQYNILFLLQFTWYT